jgi:hypothetical protein
MMSKDRNMNNRLPNESMHPEVVEARYREAELPEYCGNPLIEALPPINSEINARELLKYYPPVDPATRTKPSYIRTHAVINAADFFTPLPIHLDLEQQLSRVIRSGYLNRNPVTPGYWPGTNRAIAEMRERYKNNKGRPNAPHVTSPRGFSIIGVSGIGKSTTLKRILAMYDQIIFHSYYDGKPFTHVQITWLYLQCPRKGSLSILVKSFFQALDALLGTTYYRDFVEKSRKRVEEFIPDMKNLALKHSLGVLVIDEIQNLVNAPGTSADDMLNFLVEMDNEIGVPIVLVGTFKAEPILCGEEFRRARRAAGQGDCVWERMKEDEVWRKFAKRLWKYQVVRDPVLWTKENEPNELIHALYYESQGITDVAVKVFLLAQIYAMAMHEDNNSDDQPEGKEAPLETLTADLFRKASQESLRLLQPFLRALRNNDMDKIRKFEDIQPVLLANAIREVKAKFVTVALAEEADDETTIRPGSNTDSQPEPEQVTEPNQVANDTQQPSKPKRRQSASSTQNEEPIDQKDLVEALQQGIKNKQVPYESITKSGAIASTDSYVED